MPCSLPKTVHLAQMEVSARLARKGIATHALDARLLLMHALKAHHEDLISDPQRFITDAEITRLDAALTRRLRHEPVSRIVGQREFYGRLFQLSPDTLDPRPDTETLIDQALAAYRHLKNCGGGNRILDIGTGSGAIVLTLLAELPETTAIATDISGQALKVARNNAEHLKLAERILFLETDWADGLKGPFDMLVSNPPYIPSKDLAFLAPEVRDYDPPRALDGGLDGLNAYHHIVAAAQCVLRPGGIIILETGFEQTAEVAGILCDAGFLQHKAMASETRDLAGNPRIVTMLKSP